MKKNTKSVLYALIISALLIQVVGCKDSTNTKISDVSNKKSENKANNSSYSEKKTIIKDAIPEICNNAHLLYNVHNRLIDDKLDTENLQLLIISNTLKTAFLINSQNEKYGDKNEVIEYSTASIDKNILITPFQNIDFNGHPTYAFNIDPFFSYLKDGNRTAKGFENLVTTTLFHEGIHLFLQLKLLEDEDVNNLKSLGNTGSKSVQYPILIDDYVYRTQMANAYKLALAENDSQEKIEYIKEANYFLQKFLNISDQNKVNISLDLIEGQPRYYEHKAQAILEGHLDKENIKRRAKELLMMSADNTQSLTDIDKGAFCYQTGSNAFALLNDLGERDNLGNQNPVLYLLNKYGVKESEGDINLVSQIRNKYEEMNNKLKAEVDDISHKISSEKYITIGIPSAPGSYMSIGGKALMVDYPFKNYLYNTNTTSMELSLQNSRIKVTKSKILQLGAGEIRVEKIEDFPPSYYLFAPKDSVSFSNNRITVQSNDIQMYDMTYTIKDGIYVLDVK